MRLRLLTAVLAPAGLAGLAAVALAASGDLRQKPGRAGCVSFTGSGGACRRGAALKFPESVAASPDGKNVYVAAQSGGVAIFDRAASGALTPKRGKAGCVSQTIRSRRACALARALKAPIAVVVSPDGRDVYVAALGSDAVAAFDRRAADGTLTQKRGRAGCASRAGGSCAKARGLQGALDVAVSADGRSVYVVGVGRGGGAVVVFDRDERTGVLTQKRGPAGCVVDALEGVAGCTTAEGLSDAVTLAVSADGRSAYVGTALGLVVLDRAADGRLSPRPGPSGCIMTTAAFADCATATAVGGVVALAVSGDGRNAYVASHDGLSVFDRDTASGTLTQKAGAGGCITSTGRGRCARAEPLGYPAGVAISGDGRSAYVVAAQSGAIAVFERDAATGALKQRPGRAGCISDSGKGGCANGRGLVNPHAVTVTADGSSVYVASSTSSAVGIFDRR